MSEQAEHRNSETAAGAAPPRGERDAGSLDALKARLQELAGPVPHDAQHDQYNFSYHSRGLVVALARCMLADLDIAVWPSFPGEPHVEMMEQEKNNGETQLVFHARAQAHIRLAPADGGTGVTLCFWGESVSYGDGALAEAQENALKVGYRAILQMSQVDPADPPVADGGRSRRRSSSGGRSGGGNGGRAAKVQMSDEMLTNLVTKDSEVKRWMDSVGLDPADPDDRACLESIWQEAGQDVGEFKKTLKEEAE